MIKVRLIPKPILLGISLIFCGLIFGLSGKTASAGTNQAPDPNYFTAGGDVLLVTSSYGNGNGLDAPQGITMAYFNNPTGNTILIGNGRDLCGTPGNNTGRDGTTASYTTFQFIAHANNALLRQVDSNDLSCDSNTISLPAVPGYTLPGTNTVRYLVRVVITNWSAGSINAYRVSITSSGIMSYYNQSGSKFAIQDRVNWGPAPAGHSSTFSLPFAASCNVRSNTQVTLRWHDDDYGQSNQATGMRMELYEDGTRIGTSTNFTGNNNPGSWTVTIKPNAKYIWRWVGVSERNGIQFQLPYDSFYYNIDCNRDFTATFDATCDRIAYWVTDPDNDRYDIRIIIDGVDKHVERNQVPNARHESSLAQYKDFGTHQVSVRIVSDGGQEKTLSAEPMVGSPCAEATCDSINLTPSQPSVGQTAELRATFSTDIGSQGNPTLYNAVLSLSGPGAISLIPIRGSGSAGEWIVNVPQRLVGGGIGPNGGGGNSETAVWTVSSNVAGVYTGNVTITGGFNLTCPINSSNPVQISSQPYLRIWRGDVVAGCRPAGIAPWYSSSGSDGSIQALSRLDGVGHGSGTDLAAQALATISMFNTRQGNYLAANDGMAFANSDSSGWGGNFGSGLCASNYYSSAPSTNGSITSANLSSLPSGTYSYTSGTISGATLPAGRHLTIYVNGNLTIAGDIRPVSTSWSSISQIPSLTVIVQGDIHVSYPVQTLTGTYIAQPSNSSTGGTIATCTNGSARFANSASGRTALISNCSNTLNIYGSFVARTVKFLRLDGTIQEATASDTPGTGTAAEKFIYSPELWLAGGSGSSVDTYDAITSLPPVY